MVMFIVFVLFGSIFQTHGQFPNFFNAHMGVGGAGGSGNNCLSSVISCMPWCQRSVDSKGCHVCNCQSGGGSMMNPMSGPMFGGFTGGASPLDGASQQPPSCPPAPRTCLYPPPWCRRLVDEKRCVKCLCGQDLINYQSSLNGETTAITTKTPAASTTMKATPTTTDPSTAQAQTTPPSVQSCLLSFTCTQLCQFGYKTDSSGCPLCDCIAGGMVDVTVVATDPPGKHHVTSVSTGRTTDVISCPGLFKCAIICSNGYKTDALGCPKCECVV